MKKLSTPAIVKKAFTFAIVLCLLLCLCACNNANQLEKAQRKAAETVTTLVCEAVVTDGDATVYRYLQESSVAGETMSVTRSEYKLNSSFVLEENTTISQVETDRSKFVTLNFAKTVQNFSKTENTMTGTVTAQDLDQLFGTTVNASQEAQLTAQLVDGKLSTLTITFALQQKVVTVTYTYTY